MSNIILLEKFQDKHVRFVRQSPKEVMVPLNDIADALEYDRSVLHRLFKRNEMVLGRFSSMTIMVTEAGARETLCLTRDGLNGLLMKLDFNRIRDEVKRQSIVGFQVWAIETLSHILDADIPQQEFRPWADYVGEHLRCAKYLSETTGIKPGIAFSAAIVQAQTETGRDLSGYQKLLPPAEHETAHMTASDIGKQIGLSAVKVNKMLESVGLIYQHQDQKGRKYWRITEKGKPHGEEFPFVRNGHSGYQVKWNDSIIDELRGITEATGTTGN